MACRTVNFYIKKHYHKYLETNNLKIIPEQDIRKVFKNSSKIVSVHSEDEEILKMRKKLIKEGDVKTHPLWRNEDCAISSTRKIVIIAELTN